jgi:hypothetical protein
MVSAGVKIVPSKNMRLGSVQRWPDEKAPDHPEVILEAGKPIREGASAGEGRSISW